MSIATRIKAIRKKSGLIQAQFAKKVGVSRQTVINWEKGITEPTEREVQGIVKLFDINPKEFTDNSVHLTKDDIIKELEDDKAVLKIAIRNADQVIEELKAQLEAAEKNIQDLERKLQAYEGRPKETAAKRH